MGWDMCIKCRVILLLLKWGRWCCRLPTRTWIHFNIHASLQVNTLSLFLSMSALFISQILDGEQQEECNILLRKYEKFGKKNWLNLS